MPSDAPAIAEGKNANRVATARKKPHARSRVGNGKELLTGIDKRTLEYREFQDAVADLVAHVGGYPTPAEQILIEEAGRLVMWCRQAHIARLQSGEFDIARYCTAVNSLRRVLVDLGLKRAFDVTAVSIEDYIKAKRAQEAEQ